MVFCSLLLHVLLVVQVGGFKTFPMLYKSNFLIELERVCVKWKYISSQNGLKTCIKWTDLTRLHSSAFFTLNKNGKWVGSCFKCCKASHWCEQLTLNKRFKVSVERVTPQDFKGAFSHESLSALYGCGNMVACLNHGSCVEHDYMWQPPHSPPIHAKFNTCSTLLKISFETANFYIHLQNLKNRCLKPLIWLWSLACYWFSI